MKMKKVFVLLLSVATFFACNDPQKNVPTPPKASDSTSVKAAIVDVKDKSFEELFKSISTKEIDQNLFKLYSENFSVLTSGNDSIYNSMTASWGGWGQLFDKPVAWNFLRANRYTLELIKKNETYTVSFFDEAYKEQVLFFGSKTGKGTDKMKEVSLNKVSTPSGLITYKEASLILECKLVELTTVKPDDFRSQEGKDFVVDAYKEAKDYHKLTFGEITQVWVKK